MKRLSEMRAFFICEIEFFSAPQELYSPDIMDSF
jgi:hypothetical protein